MNMLGGWVMTWLIISGIPKLKGTAAEVGGHYAHLGANWRSFALAILAGLVMTLMTRMQHATESLGVKLVPAILFGALLAAGQLFHSVLDSLFMFAGLWSGHADYGYLDWLGMMSWAALGNLVGGLVLVTGIRLVQMRHKVHEARGSEPPDIP
jgi:formate/nitrite transporter FocA (FNT family)